MYPKHKDIFLYLPRNIVPFKTKFVLDCFAGELEKNKFLLDFIKFIIFVAKNQTTPQLPCPPNSFKGTQSLAHLR